MHEDGPFSGPHVTAPPTWPQYFHKAVILIVEHNELGTAGIILNRASKYKMAQVRTC